MNFASVVMGEHIGNGQPVGADLCVCPTIIEDKKQPVGADLCVCPDKEKPHQPTMGEHIGSPLHYSIIQNGQPQGVAPTT